MCNIENKRRKSFLTIVRECRQARRSCIPVIIDVVRCKVPHALQIINAAQNTEVVDFALQNFYYFAYSFTDYGFTSRQSTQQGYGPVGYSERSIGVFDGNTV